MAAKSTKKKRKRDDSTQHQSQTKRKLLLRSRVEVRSVEEGFTGSWHCGTVVGCSHLCRVVEYDHCYLDDGGLEKLKGKVHVSPLLEGILLPKVLNYRGIIRPIPPPCINETGGLSFGLCVDAFMDDAWWEGVIFDYEEDELLQRLVFFPDFADRHMIKTDELRKTQDWDEVEECWVVRGKWKLIELIEDFPIAVVSAAQIWHDLRQKEGFKSNIKEWTCNVKLMWVDLVVETVSQYLDIAADRIYKVISEKIGNYSVNGDQECLTSRGFSCDDEEAVTLRNQDLSVFCSDDLKLCKRNVTSYSFVREIDDGAQEGREVAEYSDEGILPTCYTANGEDELQGVGSAVDCIVNGLSNDDDGPTYGEPSLKCPTRTGFNHKRRQTAAGSGSTGNLMWLPVGTDVLPKAQYFPEALEKYLMADVRKVKNNVLCALRLKARMHLSYMGWRIEYRIRTDTYSTSRRVDIRYISPKGESPTNSLRYACKQAMESTRRQQVPLSMICRNYQGCSSPPPLCLEPESHETPCIRRKLDVHVEPEYCPQAVYDYLNGHQRNHAKNLKHLREKAKKHLSAEGWTFSLHLKDNRRDLYYTNPSNSASFKSLVSACIRYNKEVSERMRPSSRDDNPQNYECTQEKKPRVESDRILQNREPCDAENSALAVYNKSQQENRGICVKFYTRRKVLGAHVNCLPVAEESQQLTAPHINGAHSCEDYFEEYRIDTSSSDTNNKHLSALNADVGSFDPLAATPASEDSEKGTSHTGRGPCCQHVSKEGTSASPASDKLAKPTAHNGCQAASEEGNLSKDGVDCGTEELENSDSDESCKQLVDDLKRQDFDDSDKEGTDVTLVLEDDSDDDENAVDSQMLNLDCGTEELENLDSDVSTTQLVDDLKRQGFDNSDGEGTGMTLVVEDDVDHGECETGSSSDTPTSCFTKRRLHSPCEPSMKNDVVLDTNAPAEETASGSVLKSFISELVPICESSEAAACIMTKNICSVEDEEMADTIRDPILVITTVIDEPKLDHSACDGIPNMKEGRDIRAISLVKKLSYGDTSISNDFVRFKDNDSIDGGKDSLSPCLESEPRGSSCFASSHDPGESSLYNDIVDKYLSVDDFNLSEEVVPEKNVKEINFSVSKLKGTCELAKRRTVCSRIRDVGIFDWQDCDMHNTKEDGEPDSIFWKRDTEGGNSLNLARRVNNLASSDSRLMSDDLKGVLTAELESNVNRLGLDKQSVKEVQEAVVSNNVVIGGKYDAGFDTMKRCNGFCATKIPAEPPGISNKLASTFVSLERSVTYTTGDVDPVHIPASEESEQPTLPYVSPTPSEEDAMTASQEELVKQTKRKRIDEARSSDTADGEVNYLIEIIVKHFEQKEVNLRRREIALDKKEISLMKLQMDLEKQRTLLEKSQVLQVV